jgi:hypothetical protein
MMTKDEARRALGAELRSRKLAKPMTIEEINVFCEEMYKQLELQPEAACQWSDHPPSLRFHGVSPHPF